MDISAKNVLHDIEGTQDSLAPWLISNCENFFPLWPVAGNKGVALELFVLLVTTSFDNLIECVATAAG